MANRYWVGGNGTWNNSSTTNWSATSGGPAGASAPGATDNAIFDQAATYTVTIATGTIIPINDWIMSAGTVTFSLGSSGMEVDINGNLDFTGSALTIPANAGFRIVMQKASGTSTITTGGNLIKCGFLFGLAGNTATYILQDAFNSSSSGATVVTEFRGGTLDLNGKTLTCNRFQSNTGATRLLNFNGGNIICIYGGGTNTVPTWLSDVTGWSISGNPVVNLTYSGATRTDVITASPDETQVISVNVTAGTYPCYLWSGSSANPSAFKSVDFTGYSGQWFIPTSAAAFTIYGDITFSSGMTTALTSSNAITFGATTGTQNISSAGAVMQASVIFSGTATYKLLSNVTFNFSSTFNAIATLSSGTLSLNNFTLSCGRFSSSNTNTRAISFGSTGRINLLGARNAVTYQVWDTSTSTNLTTSGTSAVDFTNTNNVSGSFTHGFASGFLDEANSISFYIKSNGTAPGLVNLFQTTGYTYKNIDFTSFTGTYNTHLSGVVYGNFTLSTTMTVGANTTTPVPVITFAATSGTQLITSNGKIFSGGIEVNGIGGTVKLADAINLDVSRARTLTLTNGTFDGNGKTISSGGTVTFTSTGNVTVSNISTALAFTMSSGNLTQGAANTFGSIVLNSGTFDGGGFTTTGAFSMATGPVTIKNIVNSSAFTHTSGDMTLAGNCTFGAFTFTAGNINL